MEPLHITDDMEIKLLSAHANWMQERTDYAASMVAMHERELLIQFIIASSALAGVVWLSWRISKLERITNAE